MVRKLLTFIAAFAFLSGGLAGCQKPNLQEMMKAPPRPAELDRLNDLVGRWEGAWEMKMSGEDKPLTGAGLDTFAWDADKWVLTEHTEGTMGENTMAGTGLWLWDTQAKQYRYGSADNYGMIMTGTARYDEKTKTWHMKGGSHDTLHGHNGVGEGTLKMPDANTMEWTWTEWDGLHLIKFMEMKGTSHRK